MNPFDPIITQLTSLRDANTRSSEAELLQDLEVARALHQTINEILGCTPEQYTDLRNHDHLCIVVDLRKFMRLSTVYVPVEPGINADGEPLEKQRDLSVAKTWADVAYVLDAAEKQKALQQLQRKREAEEEVKLRQDAEAAKNAQAAEAAWNSHQYPEVSPEKSNQ